MVSLDSQPEHRKLLGVAGACPHCTHNPCWACSLAARPQDRDSMVGGLLFLTALIRFEYFIGKYFY